MKARLEIKRDAYDETWKVSVFDCDGKEIFYERTEFKWSAWIRFFIWKYITRKFELGKDVYKDIELKEERKNDRTEKNENYWSRS